MWGRLRLVVAVAAALLLAAPAAARASLVFVRGTFNESVWVANDDGSGQRRISPGSEPKMSPDGQTIVYLQTGNRGRRSALMIASTSGGAARRLAQNWREPSTFAWSPDSKTIAAVLGPEIGRKRLVLIDVASGAQRKLADGYFNGVSFSPDGGQLVYGWSAKEPFFEHSDLFRVDLATGAQVRLTRDHRSLDPLWGPSEIAFARLLGKKRRQYFAKNELFLVNPNGGKARRLTHTKVDPLTQGLFTTD